MKVEQNELLFNVFLLSFLGQRSFTKNKCEKLCMFLTNSLLVALFVLYTCTLYVDQVKEKFCVYLLQR